MIDKLVTGPLWRHLQLSSTSVLSMSKVYTKMKQKFEEWGEDAQTVVEGCAHLLPQHESDDDDVYKALFAESENDALQWYRNFCSFFLRVFLLLCNAFT